jgi:hypothetical protein
MGEQIDDLHVGPFKYAASWGNSFTRHYVKGTVSQDCLLQGFYETSSPKPMKITLESFQIFENLQRYLHMPLVSTNFAKVPLAFKFSAGMVDTCSKFANGK